MITILSFCYYGRPTLIFNLSVSLPSSADNISGYVTKAEKSHLQDIWHKVSSDKTLYHRLISFGLQCLSTRDVGLYEASDILLGDSLY